MITVGPIINILFGSHYWFLDTACLIKFGKQVTV